MSDDVVSSVATRRQPGTGPKERILINNPEYKLTKVGGQKGEKKEKGMMGKLGSAFKWMISSEKLDPKSLAVPVNSAECLV